MVSIIGIYKISFGDSLRVYIGQSVNIKNRTKYHKANLKANKHYNLKLQRSYNKYGVSNMKFEIIEICEQSKLNKLELFYINKFNSFHKGLNCTLGGDYVLTESSKLIYQYCASSGNIIRSGYGFANMGRLVGINESNIRQIVYGKMNTAKGFHFSLNLKTPKDVLESIVPKYKTEEYKLNHSVLMSGKGNGMYGKKQSLASKEKNSKSQKELYANGYVNPMKFLNDDEVIRLYKSGLTQLKVSSILNCTQVAVSEILIKNNIRKFTKRKKDLAF